MVASSTTQTPTPEPMAIEVDAVPQYLPALRNHLTGWLRDAGAPGELTARVVLAMNEAVTNAIAHAYRYEPSGSVRVAAQLRDDHTVSVTVADRGRWRPARPIEGTGGRGVLMMQECVDRVLIDRAPEGTTVTMLARLRDIPVQDDDGGSRVNNRRHGVRVHTVGDTTVARLSGEVRESAADLLRKQLLKATCGGVVPLIVDLADLDTVTDALLSVLSQVAHAADGAGERVVVVSAPSSTPAERRALAGLSDCIQVVDARPYAS